MPIKPAVLAKRTKAEIIAEYDKLLHQQEQARSTAQSVHEPRSQELISKAKQVTDNQEQQINLSITKSRSTILDHFNALTDVINSEIERLSELHQATEAVQKNLTHHHNIKVAADTLEVLINDNELKKQKFAIESTRRQTELDNKLATQEQEWEREQEEKNYQAKRKRQHEQQEVADQTAQSKRTLQERADALVKQEEEIAHLRQQVIDIPSVTEKKLGQQAKEMTAQLKTEHDRELQHTKQRHEAEQNILTIKITNQQDLIKRLQTELATLKKETDQATKRAQDLAVTIIKHQPQTVNEPEASDQPPSKSISSRPVVPG